MQFWVLGSNPLLGWFPGVANSEFELDHSELDYLTPTCHRKKMASSVPLKQLSIILLSGAAIACIFISDASTSLSTVSPVVQSRTLQRIDNQLKASRIQTYPGTTLQLRTASSTTLNEVFGKEVFHFSLSSDIFEKGISQKIEKNIICIFCSGEIPALTAGTTSLNFGCSCGNLHVE